MDYFSLESKVFRNTEMRINTHDAIYKHHRGWDMEEDSDMYLIVNNQY